VILRQNIQESIAMEQERLGRKMSDREKQPFIDRAILEMGKVKSKTMGIDWLSRDPQMPIAAMTAEQQKKAYVEIAGKEMPLLQAQAEVMDIPDAEVLKIVKAMQDAGVTRPTSFEILAAWYDKKGKK
jgi:hypothetical protein